ncbi:vWA domain-containing protein [Brevibacterium gallinarum]|uniref:VWA domain-containing protein n=1 Tax=Brevibacterium gallinarum TaxID=2762220 RepID=A0ABR8WU82_9MICO|nr:VWA domain-containing protein [Brevibacterium gallinarum]MBD8020482.1 VWA domain-containing protein [Brevibacterium gallinarum]
MRLPTRIAAALAACALTLSIPTVGSAATTLDRAADATAAEAATGATAAEAATASGADTPAAGPLADPATAGGSTAGSSGGSQPIMLIIDGSGSMKAADVDDEGTTRMDAAKDAAKDVIDNLNANAQVGLTAYGMNTGSSDAEKAAGCKDIEVLSPVGPIDADGLKKQVDSITASGYTPIGEALKKAAAELPGDGSGGIVLLSDGEDTCAPPPPCDVAKELVADGVDLKIHTVGLRVDEKARKELTCIADETHGTYADAEDTTSLQASMQAAARAALTGYEAQGTPITGGEDRASAVDIQPGQYLDSLPTATGKITESTGMRSYKFHLDEGQRGLLSATMVQPWSDSGLIDYDAVKLVVSPAQEENCSRNDTTLANAMNLGDLPPSAFVDTGAIGSDNARVEGSRCFTEAGDYIVTVERSGGSDQTKDTPFPLELNLVVQPGTDPGDFPEPATGPEQLDFLPAPGDQASPLGGGTSFGTAPELKDPVVTSSINVGEVQYFKVPVKYGQQIRVRADFEVPGKDKAMTGNPNLWILNPLRQQVTSVRPGEPGAHDFDNQEDILGKDGHAYASSREATVMALNSAVPVSPRNLDGEDDPKFKTSPASFDGFYYFAFSYSDIHGGSFGTPGEYTLSWDVVGEPTDGPGAEGAGDTGDEGDDQAAGGDQSVLMSALKWGGIALGAIVLIGAVLVAILLLRTRRARIGS